MRCKNCIHYDVCYQYDIIGEDDSEMCALYEKQRPHGEWIDTGYGTSRCSVCGEKCQTYCMDKPRDRYCLWCGAKMVKEGEAK